jgi:hypothetical protein
MFRDKFQRYGYYFLTNLFKSIDSGDEFSPYWIVNETGVNLVYMVDEIRAELGPGQKNPVRFNEMQKVVKVRFYSSSHNN